jgi:hypothetical protein
MNATGQRHLRCPATEAHARHMAHLQALTTRDERAAYIEQVRRDEGPFLAKWLFDDFSNWWARRPKDAPCQEPTPRP